MSIYIDLTAQMAKKRLSITELSDRTGISVHDLEKLRQKRAVAIKFKTLEALCEAFECAPQDLISISTPKA